MTQLDDNCNRGRPFSEAMPQSMKVTVIISAATLLVVIANIWTHGAVVDWLRWFSHTN